jgi:transcriptional regulator with XRE-family HTH domain
VTEPELSFAGLLRQLRAEAKLTQEELAEAAGVSAGSVSALERGITRTAHKDTGVLLAGALNLPEPVRGLFVAVARGKALPAEVLAARQAGPGAFAAATRALPRDIAAFTGRQAELSRLMGTLAAAAAAGGGVVGIHAIDGMAANHLRHHPAWSAAGLAAELSPAKERLALIRAENVSVAAAFSLSYQDLTPGTRRLFRRLGLVPGPDFDACAAAALDGISLGQARRHLGELYDQHLLTEPAPGRYVLHDLLREHARTLAAADDPAESGAATGRLLEYYLHTALAASRHMLSPDPDLDSRPWVLPRAARPAPADRCPARPARSARCRRPAARRTPARSPGRRHPAPPRPGSSR